MNLRKIYEPTIKNRIKKAETDRKSMDPIKLQSALLENLSEAEVEISDNVFNIAKTAKDKMLDQYYTTTTNVK